MDAGQDAVVAAVGSVFTGQVALRIQDVHHAHGQIQLLRAGLSSAHVQIQVHSLIVTVEVFQFPDLLRKFFFGHFRIGFHRCTSLFRSILYSIAQRCIVSLR